MLTGNTKTRKQPTGGVTVSHSLEVIHINKVSEDSCDEEIDVIDTDDTGDMTVGGTAVSSTGLGERHSDPGETNSDLGGNNSDPGESHSDPGKSYSGIDAVTCIEADTETQTEDDTKTYRRYSGDDVSVRRDTAAKNQPCSDTGVMCTNSGTVTEIYPSVAQLSPFDTGRAATVETVCGCSTIHTHSHRCSKSGSTHCTNIDMPLSLSPCPPASGMCPESGVGECSQVTDADTSPPGLLGAQAEGGVSCFPDQNAGLISVEIANLGECRGEATLSTREQGKTDACKGRHGRENTNDGLSDVSPVSMGTGDTVSAKIGDTMSIRVGDTMSVHACDTLSVTTGDTVSVMAGDTVSVQPGDTVSGDNVYAQAGDTLYVQAGDTAPEQTGDTVSVEPCDTVSVPAGDTVSIRDGDTVSVRDGDTVSVRDGDGEREEDDEEHLGGECISFSLFVVI